MQTLARLVLAKLFAEVRRMLVYFSAQSREMRQGFAIEGGGDKNPKCGISIAPCTYLTAQSREMRQGLAIEGGAGKNPKTGILTGPTFYNRP